MHNRGLTAAFFLSLLLLNVSASQARAEEDPGDRAFRAGIEAFEAGELEMARRHFLAAQAAGADSQALRYNLGVVFYRLEQYTAARREFQKLAQHPEVAALVHYNLGLVALREQWDAGARRAFRQVLELAEEDQLRSLARRQLERLETTVLPVADYGKGTLVVVGGYADNLSLLPQSTASQVDDGFAEVAATWSGYLYGDQEEGWHLEASLYHQNFIAEGAFNQSALRADSHYDRAWGELVTSVGVGAGSAHLNGKFVEWRAGPTLAVRGPVLQGWWKAQWRYNRIFPDEAHRPYEGSRQNFDLEIAQVRAKWDWRLAYLFEYNDRSDLTTESEFLSLSPQRHDIRASLIHQVSPRWRLGGRLAYRFSDYREPYLLNGETGSQSQIRQDYRTTVSLDLNYQLSAQWRGYAEGRVQVNESSVDAYDYQRHEAALGVEFWF